MVYWQMASGDGVKDFSDVYLKHGVMLATPGSPGEYYTNRTDYDDPAHWAYREYFATFVHEVKKGDFVILKRPHGKQWEIVAVGEVKSDYQYDQAFSDIDGWDMQHSRQVDWKRPKDKVFVNHLLKGKMLQGGFRRGTFLRISNADIISVASDIWGKN